MSDDTYNLALKVPMTAIERLDALVPDVAAEYQHLQAAGLIRKVSRSTVARLVMEAGLEALETTYKAAPPPQRVKSYTLVDPTDGLKAKAVIPPPTVEQCASGEAAAMARAQAAEPDDTDPASALVRAYGGRKPSRRSKPTTRGGRLLRQWRESNGLSQAQAADRFNVSQPTWGRWERGAATPTKAARAELEDLVEDLYPDDWTTPDAGDE
jgi:DNA-binding XRE family transcriptional regulator